MSEIENELDKLLNDVLISLRKTLSSLREASNEISGETLATSELASSISKASIELQQICDKLEELLKSYEKDMYRDGGKAK